MPPFSHSKHFKYSTRLWIRFLLQLLVLTLTGTRGSEGLQYNDLQTLTSNLPGCYSKIHQSYKYDQTAIPTHKLQFLFRSEIYKLATPLLNDSVTFYFQDLSKSTTKPVRSGFYSFSKESNNGRIRMRTSYINGSVLVSGVCRTGEHVALSHDVMKRLASKSWTFSECDMFWRRLDDGTFVGITGPLCLGSLDQNQGRIGVSMTSSKDQLLLTEGWYRLTNRLQLTEVQISYVLQKSEKPDVYKHGRHKSRNSDLEIITNEVLAPYDIPNYFSSKAAFKNKTVESSRRIINKMQYGKNRLAKKHEWKRKKAFRRRTLNRFSQILLALSSGYDVHFLIDLAICSQVGNTRRARSSFSGKVKNFVFVGQNGGSDLQNGSIHFMTRKYGVGSQGAQVTVRYVTLLSDGRVKVYMFRTDTDRPFSPVASFQCRLSQGRTPYTGAVFTHDPRDRASKVQDFQALTRTVAQGMGLNLVVDLSKCRGTQTRTRHVIGSQVTDFDLVDGGQTVELSAQALLPDTEVDLAHQVTPIHLFLGRVHINGDVSLTFISNSQSQHRDQRESSTYHCKLPNDKTSTKAIDSTRSVRMFRKK